MSAPLRLAIVGLGYWGPNLARNLARVGELAWVCDLSDDNLRRYGKLYPEARMTADLDEVLADDSVDAVAIATSVPTHHPLGMRVLAAGKHLFVEKPLALSVAEARELVEAAEDADRRLMVGHLLLFHPGLRAVKRLIDSGELGRLFYLYGNRQNLGKVRADENALWSLGAHDIAVLLDLVGERPTELQARGECYVRPGVEDVVFGYLKFPSGVVAHLHLSWLDPNKMRRLTVVGSDKMVVFDDMESDRKVTVYDKGITPAACRHLRRVRGRPLGRHLDRRGSRATSRCASRSRSSPRPSARGVPRSRDGHSGIAVVEVLAGLQRSLDEGGAAQTVDPSLA